MQFVRDADYAEVISCFRRENQGSDAFGWTVGELEKTQREIPDRWRLVLLSKSDIEGVVIAGHEHSKPGAAPLVRNGEVVSMAETAERLRASDKTTMLECWENISYQNGRDISQTHFFLKSVSGRLSHIDGFHRMLAWLLFRGEGTVPAFVAE